MASLTITHADKRPEEILGFIAKKAGGKVLKPKQWKRDADTDSLFINEMERIVKSIEKDFHASRQIHAI